MQLETIRIAELRPHPRNYVQHPSDQLAHLAESIRAHGFYRNIIIAQDNTILAGHGAVQAAALLGLVEVPAHRLDLDPLDPRALKVLAGDNEISHLREIDDRALSELLKEILDNDPSGLEGTGYDDKMLANLLYVTRPQHEIADFDEAAQWVGMPEYEPGDDVLKVVLSFRSVEDMRECARRLGLVFTDRTKAAWFPTKERDDRASVLLEG